MEEDELEWNDEEVEDPAEILPGMMDPGELNVFTTYPLTQGQYYRNMQDRYNMTFGRNAQGKWRRSYYGNYYDPDDDAYAYDVGLKNVVKGFGEIEQHVPYNTNAPYKYVGPKAPFKGPKQRIIDPEIRMRARQRRDQTQRSVERFRRRDRPDVVYTDDADEDPDLHFSSPNWIENLSIGQRAAGDTINRYVKRFRQLNSLKKYSKAAKSVGSKRGMTGDVVSNIARFL